MSKQWVFVGVVVAGLATGAFALSRFGPDIQRVEVGAKAPDFKVVNLATGDSVSLREHYEGSVTLVNIWATWCIPCRVEMPAMERVYRDLAFAQDLELTFDVLQDRSTAIQQTYQTTGVPESFLINRRGIIVKRIIGAHDWGSPVNRALVERLLNDASS